MKHLCRRSEPKSFAGAVIQSVFDHLNFLVRNACHLALLGHVLPQQAIEVIVGATLPARKGPGKVARAAERFINRGVPTEFFAVVIGQRLDPGFKRLERFDDRRARKLPFTLYFARAILIFLN
jgi:hypothetical protein